MSSNFYGFDNWKFFFWKQKMKIFDFVKMPRLYWIVGPIVVITMLILDRNAFKIKYPILFQYFIRF